MGATPPENTRQDAEWVSAAWGKGQSHRGALLSETGSTESGTVLNAREPQDAQSDDALGLLPPPYFASIFFLLTRESDI